MFLTTYSPQSSSRRSKNEFCMKESLELLQTPPDISPLESLLPLSVTLVQLHSGRCRLKHIQGPHSSGMSDVCMVCGVAPHSSEHLFKCQSRLTQLTVQTYGTTWPRSQTCSTSTTDYVRRAVELLQQLECFSAVNWVM